jgi:hypothetical protein
MSNAIALLLVMAGIGQIVLGLSHAVLPRLLGWTNDLSSTSDMTRAVSYVHTFFIGLVVAGFGACDLFYRHELLADEHVGRGLVGLMTLFWGCRFVAQATVFRSVTRSLAGGKLLQPLAVIGWITITLIHAASLAMNLTV